MKYISAKDIRIKKRSKNSCKGQHGKALIIGGSEDYVGALALAGLAALRSGCDWVTIAAPEKVAWAINTLSPDLITKKLKGTYLKKSHLNTLLKLSEGFDAVLIGNGMGKKSAALARNFIRRCRKPLVIDADAIKAISLKDTGNSIITPHKKELETLLKNSKTTKEQVKKHIKDNILLIKGNPDIIIAKEKTFYNKTGNEAMAVAGTGDVLAGLCVGFLSQNYTKLESAKYAAYFNGKTGDVLKKKKGYAMIASDIIDDFRKIIKKR